MSETICQGQDGLIFLRYSFVKKKKKSFSRNADGILILCLQRWRNLAFPRVLMARMHAGRANKNIRWGRLITGQRDRNQVAGEEVITWYGEKGFE